ncbi:RNA-directed DNA polymerase [Aporhodopirellula aestuarii]|uniref:RNA-directed DNA polymerase n=1 Tax=Aporhodopirellula aestuarii TaxID=2950107 RepID=A0ABT0U5L1_9BACT|nr:RNA-directed DNA polymerase [Aporhodopirellula aestuarii]MCM2372092.1 RNA-directed DNA polymerase [Aporhodopirellula aestuarii]
MKPDILAARALNAARIAHLPTYVAMRAMLDSRTDRERVSWIMNVAAGKASTRTEWRYYDFPILKELEKEGTAVYRDYTLGSPTTLLAEAHVLHLLSHSQAFAVPECVYSYHWPQQERSSRNYQYFFDGYTARNQKIAKLLSTNPDHVAVISDIRHFYPSVAWDVLQAKFERRLDRVEDRSTKSKAIRVLEGVRAIPGRGIPIGPDFAHLLGHVALEDVDTSLFSEFGERYLRYVDDLIVVCPAAEAKGVATTIASAVTESEFEVHEGKNDVVPAAAWLSDCPSMKDTDDEPAFNALIRDLTVYLMLKPKSFDSIRQIFEAEGFSIPLERLRTQSKYGPFRRFIHYRHLSGIVDIAKLYFWKDSDFLSRAIRVRNDLSDSLKGLLAVPVPANGMSRRWFVQKCRYHLNRLLYLLPQSSYGQIRSSIPDGSEFDEYRILLDALISGNVNAIARLPGRAVGFFCELTSEHGAPDKHPWEGMNERAVAESACAMALYFGWQFSADELSSMYEGSRTLLQACSTGVADRDQIRPHSYLDEVELLLRGTSTEDRHRYVQTRSDEDELIGLEGLWLGERNDFS